MSESQSNESGAASPERAASPRGKKPSSSGSELSSETERCVAAAQRTVRRQVLARRKKARKELKRKAQAEAKRKAAAMDETPLYIDTPQSAYTEVFSVFAADDAMRADPASEKHDFGLKDVGAQCSVSRHLAGFLPADYGARWRLVADDAEFRARWDIAHPELAGLDLAALGLVAAGGAVGIVATCMDVPGADVDLFFCRPLSADERKATVRALQAHLRRYAAERGAALKLDIERDAAASAAADAAASGAANAKADAVADAGAEVELEQEDAGVHFKGFRTVSAVTFFATNGGPFAMFEVQVVVRGMYESPRAVIARFDLPASKMAFDGTRVWLAPSSVYALRAHVNLIDYSRVAQEWRYNLPHRLIKYFQRGYGIIDPGFITDMLQQNQGSPYIRAWFEAEQDEKYAARRCRVAVRDDDSDNVTFKDTEAEVNIPMYVAINYGDMAACARKTIRAAVRFNHETLEREPVRINGLVAFCDNEAVDVIDAQPKIDEEVFLDYICSTNVSTKWGLRALRSMLGPHAPGLAKKIEERLKRGRITHDKRWVDAFSAAAAELREEVRGLIREVVASTPPYEIPFDPLHGFTYLVEAPTKAQWYGLSFKQHDDATYVRELRTEVW
jgi:hypothetical protein